MAADAIDALRREVVVNAARVCGWRQMDDDTDAWEGDCGIVWQLLDGTPAENRMVYRPRCGGTLRTRRAACAPETPEAPR